jgi:phosphoadenosine phosphosulfate reductase
MSAVALYAKASPDFAGKLAETTALLQRAQAEFAPLTQASSLGAEDMVITHLLAQLGLDCSVFVLDTGVLHTQTLDLISRIESHYSRKVDVFRPAPGRAEAFVAENGAAAMYQSIGLRKACCGVRKLEPLGRALTGKRGWLTGLRREQSQARAEVEFIEIENLGTPAERAKINPLARWTSGDVWHFIGLQAVPYNPLHDAFFPSIGCAPCTRAVTLGEDIRSGRWWWEQAGAKECGLHVASDLASVNESSVIPSKATA